MNVVDLMKGLNSIILDVLTLNELKEKGENPFIFEWNINFKNINLIPELELYDKNKKIYKRIESVEFSEELQMILKDTYELHNDLNEFRKVEINNVYLDFLEKERVVECSNCPDKDICPIQGRLKGM